MNDETREDYEWHTTPPPADVMLRIKCDDFSGDYTMLAMRVDYKQPKPGQNPRGFRKGWRWVKETGQPVTRKETPSAWAYVGGDGK